MGDQKGKQHHKYKDGPKKCQQCEIWIRTKGMGDLSVCVKCDDLRKRENANGYHETWQLTTYGDMVDAARDNKQLKSIFQAMQGLDGRDIAVYIEDLMGMGIDSISDTFHISKTQVHRIKAMVEKRIKERLGIGI